MDRTLYVILGRIGDILAALPIVQCHVAEGRKACVMVSAEYAHVLDGFDLDRIVWQGDWRHVRAARESVRRDWPRCIVLQQYATDGWPVARGTDSFVKSMYHAAGRLKQFPLPLRVSRRSPEREAALRAGVPDDRPLVLTATLGHSSPFPHGAALRQTLSTSLPSVCVLNLDDVRGERVTDLLALLERAVALVSIDSAILHLSQATPSLPVIALIASSPSLWHGSPAYRNQILRVRYHDFPIRIDALVATIKRLLPTRNQVKSQ